MSTLCNGVTRQGIIKTTTPILQNPLYNVRIYLSLQLDPQLCFIYIYKGSRILSTCSKGISLFNTTKRHNKVAQTRPIAPIYIYNLNH